MPERTRESGFGKARAGIVAGLATLLALLVVASAAPWLAPAPPSAVALEDGLKGPSAHHPLGQDRLGRDILARIFYGARASLLVGGLAVTLSAGIGLLLGGISGFVGGRLDEGLMRLTEILQAFPGILLAIAFSAILGPSLTNVVVALSLIGWVGYARLTRGQVLLARELPYVESARSLGASAPRILVGHIAPNILAPLLVEASFGMASAIVGEASLSFLGLGAQPPTPSWGSMLNEARAYLMVAPHLLLFPGLAIALVVLGLNLLGDGLRDWLDVR